jgi:hypothetical protein
MATWFPASGYARFARPVKYDSTKGSFIRVEKRSQAAATA